MIVPGFAGALKSGGPRQSAWPQLALLAGRGSLARRWDRGDFVHGALAPWQRGFLEQLELGEHASRYASAPTALAAEAKVLAGGYWMHAELVHFAAGLDRLTLVPLVGAAAVTAAERAALRQQIAEHLLDAGFELHAAARAWFIGSRVALDLTSTCPETAAASALDESLPQGRDAGALRRLMTELQMVLHDHAANRQRELHGLPAINAVWLWGGGSACIEVPARDLPAAFADEPFVRGLYRLHGEECRAQVADAGELLASLGSRARALAAIRCEDAKQLESDWFGPLARALGEGRIAHLDLVLDDWHLSLSRLGWRCFWRRPHPLDLQSC